MADFRDLANRLAAAIKSGPEALQITKPIPQRRPPEARRHFIDRPEAYFGEVFGTKLSPQQAEATRLALTHRQLMIPSGNGLGKTLWAARFAVYVFDVVGAQPDKAAGLEEQGVIVLLPGPDHTTIKDTIWANMLEGIETAERRGYPMPGEWSTRSVHWIAAPTWYVRAFSPRRRANATVASSASGRHKARMISIMEEGQGNDEPVWTAVDGMCSGEGNHQVVLLNPTTEATSAYKRARRGDWHVVKWSALDFPNVKERRTVFPGAVSHLKVEQRIAVECIDRGAVTSIVPESAHHDFVYALPPRPDADGFRADDIPGHPDGDPRVYRPNPTTSFAVQVLGEWGSGGEGSLFDAAAWDAGVSRWIAGTQSALPPDRVGVDCARTGDDDSTACPAWGRDAEDLLKTWREIKIKTAPEKEDGAPWWERDETPERPAKPAPEEVLDKVRRRHRIRTGPIEVGPKGDGLVVATWLRGAFPDLPFVVDESSVGSSPVDMLTHRFGADVTGVSFGGSPRPPVHGERHYVNMRSQLYGRAAELVRLGLVDPPDDAMLREEVMAHRFDSVSRPVDIDGKREHRDHLRLESKDDVKARIGRSPDRADAWVLALFPVTVKSFHVW